MIIIYLEALVQRYKHRRSVTKNIYLRNIGGRWQKNLWGHNKRRLYIEGPPKVKIKDFIISLQNSGGGARAPSFYTPSAHVEGWNKVRKIFWWHS